MPRVELSGSPYQAITLTILCPAGATTSMVDPSESMVAPSGTNGGVMVGVGSGVGVGVGSGVGSGIGVELQVLVQELVALLPELHHTAPV